MIFRVPTSGPVGVESRLMKTPSFNPHLPAALIFALGVITSLYRKAGPNEALIVYGLGGTRVVKGHGTMVFPMVQTCR